MQPPCAAFAAHRGGAAGSARLLVAALLGLVLSGCGPKVVEPATTRAPYDGPRLWGIAPFLNESGVSTVDTARIADAFMSETQQVAGIDVVPVNRVIAALRRADLNAVTSHGEALMIMNALQLDGLVVGTVTAYDPYRPLTLGMAVHLYTRDPLADLSGLDPRALTRSTAGAAAPGELGPPRPVAQAAGVFHADDQRTIRRLEDYAAGRHELDSAYGPDIYRVSMELYTRFVCYRLLTDLLRDEQTRLTLAADNPP